LRRASKFALGGADRKIGMGANRFHNVGFEQKDKVRSLPLTFLFGFVSPGFGSDLGRIELIDFVDQLISD